MYTQSFNVPDGPDTAAASRDIKPVLSAHEQQVLVKAQMRFDEVIDADGKIEPKDWMPQAYRKTLVRQLSQQPPKAPPPPATAAAELVAAAYERGKAMGVFAEQCVAKYSFTREEQAAAAELDRRFKP